jgi:siroheme synthase-like protein
MKTFGMKEEDFPRFPIFIDLSNKKIVIIGGGNIATRRVETLVNFGAKITVIAPKISQRIRELFMQGKITVILKEYEKSDLLNAFIVIIATNNKEVNELTAKDARELNILVNRADDKEDCDFFFPAIISDEHIVGGIISKEGSNHNIVKEKAAEIRKFLNKGDLEV